VSMNRMAREAARAHRETARLAEKAKREHARHLALREKEEKHQYLEARVREAEDKNEEVQEKVEQLEGLLLATLSIDDAIAFTSLKSPADHSGRHPFRPPFDLATAEPRPEPNDFTRMVRPPAFWDRILPGSEKRYQRRLAEAQARFRAADAAWTTAESARQARLETLRIEHEGSRIAVEQHDKQVDDFEEAYRRADREAIIAYAMMVLERSEYPDGFPQRFRVTYEVASRRIVVDYELPGVEIVPAVAEYRYVKSKDSIEEKSRKPADVKERYSDVVASVALRTLHEIFEADAGSHIDVAVFSGFVDAIDPATGKDIHPCLISVSATKTAFAELDLARVDRRVCLRNLGAQVSGRPEAVQPVRPLVEFDMVDARFVADTDVLADLESRPNLMELNPFAFETLVANLFTKMGLETKQTRSSRDGGVDAVAFDARPVLGGKVVIQAKRYRHTVGVAAVRDLYGTMINEGANKGILVTTSGYGPDAFNFAKDKPIELIAGSGLLYLLDQIGMKATIVFPEEAVMPTPATSL
jgi:restriction system protein